MRQNDTPASDWFAIILFCLFYFQFIKLRNLQRMHYINAIKIVMG